jgi:tellurite resistance protein
MFQMSSLARSVAVALALAIGVAPLAASAQEKGKQEQAGKRREKHFPMKADEFKKHVEKRITRSIEKLDKVLAKRNVPAAKRAEIKKDAEAAAVLVRAAAARVAADGSVTKEEAKEVRALAKDLKKKARAKHLPGKTAA